MKKQGATDEQVMTELAGHIFHEAVHQGEEGLDAALLNGRSSFGEVTTVTAQMAYYLDKGYQGPSSYDSRRMQQGLRKIQDGAGSVRDYDIATYVASQLLLRSLQETYPELFREIMQMNALEACRHIVGKLSYEQRQQLIPSLKNAIARSADEEEYKKITEQLRPKDLSSTK